ncbi:MAG: hypothetical protein EON59_02145 [Alphaproteobacteria bacterium]|nr:MAG: hypothetical protein EON59_02145 [Alphaproteobacteria bacterium]
MIVAGAAGELFDALASESSKAFAPNGDRILRPTRGGLSADHARDLLAASRTRLKALSEATLVNTIVLAITPAGADDTAFRDHFFPFALYRPVSEPDYSEARSVAKRNQIRNRFVERLKREAIAARHQADIVKGVVSRANMNPLLLPVRNFDRNELNDLLRTVYDQIGLAQDAAALLTAATRQFEVAMPYVKPPDGQRRCFSNGAHLFKSPGNDRHGYYRNARDADHQLTCLLNARSRLGGGFAYDFHFDCVAVRRLNTDYPDCHGQRRVPKSTHVNIAPSDAII